MVHARKQAGSPYTCAAIGFNVEHNRGLCLCFEEMGNLNIEHMKGRLPVWKRHCAGFASIVSLKSAGKTGGFS